MTPDPTTAPESAAAASAWPPPGAEQAFSDTALHDAALDGATNLKRVTPSRSSTRRALAAALGLGVLAAAVGLGHPGNSVALAALIVASAVAATCATRVVGGPRRLLMGGAIAFAPWLAIRASAWLLVPDLIAIVVLCTLALTGRNGSALHDSAAGYRRRMGRAVIGAIDAPLVAQRGLTNLGGGKWRHSVRPIVGPAVLGLTSALVVTVILASGDALFASYFEVGDVVSTALGRFAAACLAMSLVVVAGGIAVGSEQRPALSSRGWATPRSAIVAFAPLCVVYVMYVAVQCSTLLLGADHVRDRTGLTFAEYARGGFFQLVAVGVLTFVALTVLRPIARDADRRERLVLRVLGAVASACTIAMVVAAIAKLDLYGDVFGLTMLRLHTTVFAVWLGLALAIAMFALLRLDGEWVVPAVACTALVGVLAMNVVNPERIVAEHNLTETIDSTEFDIAYLVSLSDDAVPAIVTHLDELSPSDRDRAVAELCRRPERTGALDWNASVSRASARLTDVCRD